ncbi:succinate dehydrogenase assembly factor 2 [Acidisoma cladoniae]|jgi:antitoxin CptB|uniref:FAD assembly factor SdhE n=1 Tax=Acidisoma cladoniae TaxID=3040935 RepID=UPI00254CE6C4|nr:succinate dehydrogenase assembly factor 2 [Acidisoma sp. PAMC 29798]
MTEPVLDSDTRRRRLLFRATHRGTHENDLLIGGFVTARLAAFTEDELTVLERLLDLPDADLAEWLTRRQPIPPEHDHPMMRAMVEAGGK